MHKTSALANHCKQLFLEVIKDNHRAVRFYENHGYRPVYTLKYYFCMVQSLQTYVYTLPYNIIEISFEMLEAFRNALPDCHINWQSDTPYYSANKNETYLGAYEEDKLIGMMAMSPQGKINFIWVDPAYRNRGLGRIMVQKSAQQQQNIEKVTTCLPNNGLYEGFLRKLGFEKEPLEQYEMYLPL